jgi:hypothetical protein
MNIRCVKPTQASHTLFRTFQPRDPALRGIIAYYYLHHAEADTPEQRFIYYPHYRNAVTCYQVKVQPIRLRRSAYEDR